MYIDAEEKLLDKVGLLEDGAEYDVKGGEATRLGIESSVVTLRISSGAAELTYVFPLPPSPIWV